MRDAKRDLLRLKNLKQSKSYTSNIDFKWLVNTLRRYINGWVEGREISMELVEKLSQAEAREAEFADKLERMEKALREVQWSSQTSFNHCPICGGSKDVGHSDDCLIKQALEGSEEK